MNTQVPVRKLLRSRRDRIFLGVCGGLAEYFGIDPILVRLTFVAVAMAGGASVLAYIVLAIVMPEGEPLPTDGTAGAFDADGSPAPTSGAGRHASMVGALILIGIGALFLIDSMHWFGWFRPGLFWPLILIGIGVALLFQRGGDGQ